MRRITNKMVAERLGWYLEETPAGYFYAYDKNKIRVTGQQWVGNKNYPNFIHDLNAAFKYVVRHIPPADLGEIIRMSLISPMSNPAYDICEFFMNLEVKELTQT